MPACIRYCTEEFRPLSFQKDSSGWIQTSAIQISTGDKVPIPTTLIQVATNLYNFNLFIHVILWREVVQKHSLNQSQPPWNMSIKYKTTHQTMAFTDKQESMSRWRLLINKGVHWQARIHAKMAIYDLSKQTWIVWGPTCSKVCIGLAYRGYLWSIGLQ